MNKKQRLTIGDMVDYKGNLYRALGESNEAKNSVIVMRTKQKLEPPYQEQGIDMRAADLNQDEGMNTSSSAPLSADSLRAIFEPLEKSGFPTDSVMKAIDAYTAAALQTERQRIVDSLPEMKTLKISSTLTGGDLTAKDFKNYGFNEAIEAVRAVLIPPTGKLGGLETPGEPAK